MTDHQENVKKKKVIKESVITFAFFLVIGLVLWKTQGHVFFLFNFAYIGFAAASGEFLFGILPREKKSMGRKSSQLLIGSYMLGVLGFLGRENMQIEGFFFYLLAGVFSGPVLHYLIAKIGGTVLFGRGWCGWACWTTMVLDFLPWMKPRSGRKKGWGVFRYIHFFAILALILVIWFGFEMHGFHNQRWIALQWLIYGNALYFSIGLILAAFLKDNRAFCKYVCPIPAFLKIGSRFSLWKMEIDKGVCIECGLCEEHCPMNIKLLSYMHDNQRVLSTECIACHQCVSICPTEAVAFTRKFDSDFKEHLDYDQG